jgi:hypothetical protein
MQMDNHFKKFHSDIKLNKTRVKRIKSAHETWEAMLRNDAEVGDLVVSFYLQGSYATHTAIRPQGEDGFDVDAVLVLDLDGWADPKNVIEWLAGRMRSKGSYESAIEQRDRCVRVSYVGDFHIDIVPAKPNGATILIPSKEEGRWVETNPRGFITWCAGVNQENQGMFTRVVKYVKHWRNITMGATMAPPSILLTTLVGNSMIGDSSDAVSLVLTLEKLVSELDAVLDSDGEPMVQNPSLDSENLARDWGRAKYDSFRQNVERLAKESRDALDESDAAESVGKWQGIFGSAFPGSVSEAAQIAADMLTGGVFVSRSGEINRVSGRRIPRSRFYGDS